jgi:Ca2+-binding RTX toxin-like protein
MFRFLSKCMGIAAGQATGKTAATTRPQGRPRLESLEDRQLLSGVVLSNGALIINGTAGRDTAVVHSTAPVTIFGHTTPGSVTVDFDNQHYSFTRAQVYQNKVYFFGGAGNDYFDNESTLESHAWGGTGDDTLIAGRITDVSYGSYSHNWFHGGDGNDYLRGGALDDHLYGEGGTDTLLGLGGNDYLNGGKDGYRDYLYGGSGADTFVREPIAPYWWVNRDQPGDFSSAQGDTLAWS